MSVRSFSGVTPRIAPDAYIDAAATVIGDVTIGAAASLWPCVVARGDVNSIVIGDRTDIQDATVLPSAAAPRRCPRARR